MSLPKSLHLLRSTLLLILLFLPATASATVMRYADMERLLDTSDLVVHATVIDLITETDDSGALWTVVSLDVHQSFLGEAPSKLIVHQFGGDDGHRQVLIPGDARFRPDQEAVLFLSRDEYSLRYSLTALSQGLFEITTTPDGAQMIQRDLSAISFLVSTTSGVQVLPHYDPPHSWTSFQRVLNDLIQAREESP